MDLSKLIFQHFLETVIGLVPKFYANKVYLLFDQKSYLLFGNIPQLTNCPLPNLLQTIYFSLKYININNSLLPKTHFISLNIGAWMFIYTLVLSLYILKSFPPPPASPPLPPPPKNMTPPNHITPPEKWLRQKIRLRFKMWLCLKSDLA